MRRPPLPGRDAAGVTLPGIVPPPGAARPPSPAMRKYVEDLAARLKVKPPSGYTKSAEACRGFLDRHAPKRAECRGRQRWSGTRAERGAAALRGADRAGAGHHGPGGGQGERPEPLRLDRREPSKAGRRSTNRSTPVPPGRRPVAACPADLAPGGSCCCCGGGHGAEGPVRQQGGRDAPRRALRRAPAGSRRRARISPLSASAAGSEEPDRQDILTDWTASAWSCLQPFQLRPAAAGLLPPTAAAVGPMRRFAPGLATTSAGVQLVPPAGRSARRPVPDQEPRAAEAVLAELPWRRVTTWRHGTKGALAARFAATRVRVGDGPTWGNNRHLPGDEAWLVGEWRPNGERKYYLSNLPPDTPLRELAAAIKARWVCEQAHQQLKQELGLGHFEGRSWTGLHRHALMTCIAFAYLQHLRLAEQRSTGSGKNAAPRSGAATIAEPARRAPRHHRHGCSPGSPRQVRCPHCYRKMTDGARTVNHHGNHCRSPSTPRSWALRDVTANVTSGNATVYAGAFRAAADSRGARS